MAKHVKPPLNTREIASLEELKSGVAELKPYQPLLRRVDMYNPQIQKFLKRLGESKASIEAQGTGTERRA